MPRPLFALILALAVFTASAAHAATKPHAGATHDPLVWRGDQVTAHALMHDLAKAWTRHSRVPIHLEAFSTISGIDAVAAGKADFAGSARPAFTKRKDEQTLDFVPVAWDALVMVTRRGNHVHDISLRQLNDVYYGRIINWQGLGGPNHPLHLYAVVARLDGVEFSLRQYLFGHGNAPTAAPRLYINTQQLEAAVALDRYALGATTLSSAMGNRKLAMLSVEGVKPTPAHVADGSYPLTIPLYLVLDSNDPHYTEVEKFVAFLHTKKAKAIMRAHHVLPWNANGPLAQHHSEHLASVQQRSHHPVNGPLAAPGATYAAAAAVAPISQRTARARKRMQAERRRRTPGTVEALPAAAASTQPAAASTAAVPALPSR